MRHFSCLFLTVTIALLTCACSKDNPVNSSKPDNGDNDTDSVVSTPSVTMLDKSDIPDYGKFIKPSEFSYDLLDCNSEWSWWRSAQSEHFVLFWGKGYGKYGLYAEKAGEKPSSPSTLPTDSPYYVDIDDLLEKAEAFFDFYVNELGFLETGKGTSCVDKYKIQIYLIYDTDWLATGSGYDNKIGALWIKPQTCKPVGSTIAHEIGHSFQYMVYCDQLIAGLPDNQMRSNRYNIGIANYFWEQCAQWQAYMMYGKETFSGWFSEFGLNVQKHFLHQDYRYANYFLQSYWAEKHGVKIVSDVWKAGEAPEDALETYMKVTSITLDELNRELYEYAARCTTWDFSLGLHDYSNGISDATTPIRELGKNYIGNITCNFTDTEDGRYLVAKEKAPEATGFNHIKLNLPDSEDNTVKVNFRPELSLNGYGPLGNAADAGWTVGFVTLMSDGSRVYSDPVLVSSESDITYQVPDNAKNLWLVVSATPSKYMSHPAKEDGDNASDVHWPYSITVQGSNLDGRVSFDGTETVSDAEIRYEASMSCADGYDGALIKIEGRELQTLAKAMVMQPDAIFNSFPENREDIQKSEVKIAAVEADGSLSYNYTANGYGFWYDKNGNVTDWANGYVFIEFHPETRLARCGLHPSRISEGNQKPGDKYTVSYAIVYGEHKTVFTYDFTVVK